jgi:hypothetical protein
MQFLSNITFNETINKNKILRHLSCPLKDETIFAHLVMEYIVKKQ